MFKQGQFYKQPTGENFVITHIEKDYIHLIYDDGYVVSCSLHSTNFEHDKLIAEYSTWQEAVNSSCFKKRITMKQEYIIGQHYPNKGVYAGNVDNKDIFVALYDCEGDENGELNWEDAVKEANKNGYHLPNIRELTLVWLNKDKINEGLKTSGGEAIKDGYYWSSTEHSATTAWSLRFGNGVRWLSIKGSSGNVRPVLAL